MRQRTTRRNWHRVYFLLAFFDVLVVAFGLALNHRLLQIHADSVEVNEVWEQRLDRFLDLSDLAATVNAPGNDVFDSGDVAAETNRLEQALADMVARRAASSATPPRAGPISPVAAWRRWIASTTGSTRS